MLTRRAQTSAKAADPEKFLTLSLSWNSEHSAKNSYIRVVIRMSTKIECFVVSETSHSEKNHKILSRTRVSLSAKFAVLLTFHNRKKFILKVTISESRSE